MRWLWILLGILGLLGLVIAFMPLKPLATRFVPELQAESIEGTIWNAQLRGVEFQGIPIGNIDTSLSFRQLLRGRADVEFKQLEAPFRGNVAVTQNMRAVHSLAGAIAIPVLPAPIPPVMIRMDDVGLLMHRTEGCKSASGTVTAEIRDLPILGTTPLLVGTPRCDGPALLAPMRSPRRDYALNVRVWPGGRWKAEFGIQTESELVVALLGAAGFRAVPGGVAMTVAGTQA